jgi:hypothetical protein
MKRIFLMASFFSFIAGLFSPSASAADYKVADAYSVLCDMVFSTKPDSIGDGTVEVRLCAERNPELWMADDKRQKLWLPLVLETS